MNRAVRTYNLFAGDLAVSYTFWEWMNVASWHLCFSKGFEKKPHIPIMLLACQISNSRISMSDQGDIHATPNLNAIPIQQIQLHAVLPPPAPLTNANQPDGKLLIPARRGFSFVTHTLGFPDRHFTKLQPKDCQVTGQSFIRLKATRSCF